MAKETRVARAEFTAYLVLDENEDERYDCSQVSTVFALNQIPTAKAFLALGRLAGGRAGERGLIHDRADRFRVMRRAKIVLEPKGAWSPADVGNAANPLGTGRWNDAGKQVIFDGYIAGAAYRVNRGIVHAAVHLTHWLSDLNYSSSLSSQSHPGAPLRFRWKAIYESSSSGSSSLPPFLQSQTGAPLFTETNIQSDFWAKCLHPMFRNLADTEVLEVSSQNACGPVQDPNKLAYAALGRFETAVGPDNNGAGGSTGSATSPYYKPLELELGSVPVQIATAIRAACLQESSMDLYFGTTIWDKLVGRLAPQFNFAIVPRVHSAIVAPAVPGLRQAFHEAYGNGKLLYIDDIAHMDMASLLRRPLRAVGIVAAPPLATTGAVSADYYSMIGGCYPPALGVPAEEASGMVLFAGPPAWLAGVPFHSGDANRASASPANQWSSTTTPVAGSRSSGSPGNAEQGGINDLADYYQRAAHWLYTQEMLRGRSAVIQTKLRFDLAPGTNLRVVLTDPAFLPNDQFSQDWQATIVGVNSVIDAEQRSAGTTLQLEYVRTRQENTLDRFSTARHPLYSQAFPGASLLDAYLFPE